MKNKPTSHGARVLATLLIFLQAAPSWAVLNTSNSATGTQAEALRANLQPKAQSCEEVCEPLVTENGLRGLAGTVGWTKQDDQWCANHGSQTEALVPATTLYSTPTDNSCNVPLAPGEDCATANKKLNHCTYHNSQMEPYCMAFKAAKDADPAEKLILMLDIAATVACTAACATTWTGVSQAGCKYAGLVASGAETFEVLTQKSSIVGKALKGLLTAGGGAAAAVKTKMEDDKQACVAAGLFAIMTGIRAAAIQSQDKTKDKACKNIQSLLSEAGVSVENSNSAGGASGGSSATWGASRFAASGSGGGGGSSASGSSGANTAGALSCLGQGGGLQACTSGSNQSDVLAATDGGLLVRSGLDREVGKLTSGMNLDDLLNRTRSNDVGSMVGAALGNAGVDGEVARAVSNLVDTAQAEADALNNAPGLNISSVSAGGGKSSAPAQKGNPFDSLGLFGKADGGAASGPQNLAYDTNRAPASGDIWHTGTDKNIFEIVSSKIAENHKRVDSLEWASPINKVRTGSGLKKPGRK